MEFLGVKETPKNSRERRFKNVCTQHPCFFFWNSLLLNGFSFYKLGKATQGNLQLSGIAYFGKFWKLDEKKYLIR